MKGDKENPPLKTRPTQTYAPSSGPRTGERRGDRPPPAMKPRQLERYAALCGWALARAHARTGRAPVIAGYLGESDRFERAIERFSVAYADQNEDDHHRVTRAVAEGALPAAVE